MIKIKDKALMGQSNGKRYNKNNNRFYKVAKYYYIHVKKEPRTRSQVLEG